MWSPAEVPKSFFEEKEAGLLAPLRNWRSYRLTWNPSFRWRIWFIMTYDIFKTLIFDTSHYYITIFLYFYGFLCYWKSKHFIDTNIWRVNRMSKNNFKENMKEKSIIWLLILPFLSTGNTEVMQGTLQPCEITIYPSLGTYRSMGKQINLPIITECF